jgi:Uma2 family endonuclease
MAFALGSRAMPTLTMLETSLDPYAGLSDDQVFEVIDGKIKERPPMGSYPVELASILQEYLGPFVRDKGLGRSIVEIMMRVNPTKIYRPDLAFISAEKWPTSRRAPKKRPWDLVPDLAVEVISENDTAWEVLTKIGVYFEAGTKAVWLIYPNVETIHIYNSFTQIRVLTKQDTLEGGEVIPGFRLPLELLFAGEAPEGDESDPID